MKKRFGFVLILISFCTFFCLAGCAPSLYSINMKYEPSGIARSAAAGQAKSIVTVTAFEDLRKVPDKMMIGKVIKTDGKEIPVFPKYLRPSDAVSSGIKDYLSKAGFTVSGERPTWDLKEDSIRPEWGEILVGGSIDEMEVTCVESITNKKYQARVKLTVYFADVQKKFVFFKTMAQSSSSLEHIIFSEEKLEAQMNGALSDAIQKLFEGGSAEAKILEAVKGRKD